MGIRELILFIIINKNIRVSLHIPQLIVQTLKLITM
jgi:hypothetical protein